MLDKVFHIKVPAGYKKEFLIEQVNCKLWNDDTINPILYESPRYSPFSIFIENLLKPIFAYLFTDSRDYECTFDIFEYFLGINYYHIICGDSDDGWIPRGIYYFRRRNPDNLYDAFFTKTSANGQDWSPIKQGMFNGDYSVYREAKKHADDFLKSIRYY